jgi:hypothetical protein
VRFKLGGQLVDPMKKQVAESREYNDFTLSCTHLHLNELLETIDDEEMFVAFTDFPKESDVSRNEATPSEKSLELRFRCSNSPKLELEILQGARQVCHSRRSQCPYVLDRCHCDGWASFC